MRPTDKQQSTKVQKTRKKDFSELIEQHQGIIHKITLVYANHQADREDLFQEICLQLWRAYPKFRGESKFSTWMYRVALNTAISMVRKNQRRPVFETLHGNEKLVEEESNEAEQLKLLYRGIAQLNHIDKAIILLWLEDKSYEEIAEVLGTSKGNIGVKLVRIRKKLEEWVLITEKQES